VSSSTAAPASTEAVVDVLEAVLDADRGRVHLCLSDGAVRRLVLVRSDTRRRGSRCFPLCSARPRTSSISAIVRDPRAFLMDATDRLHFKVEVDVVESMSSELYAYFEVKGAEQLHSEQLDELAADAGLEDLPGGGAGQVVARLDAHSAAEHGREIDLVLDTSQVKLFDPDGGRSLTHAAA
jgi:hypothetical protein